MTKKKSILFYILIFIFLDIDIILAEISHTGKLLTNDTTWNPPFKSSIVNSLQNRRYEDVIALYRNTKLEEKRLNFHRYILYSLAISKIDKNTLKTFYIAELNKSLRLGYKNKSKSPRHSVNYHISYSILDLLQEYFYNEKDVIDLCNNILDNKEYSEIWAREVYIIILKNQIYNDKNLNTDKKKIIYLTNLLTDDSAGKKEHWVRPGVKTKEAMMNESIIRYLHTFDGDEISNTIKNDPNLLKNANDGKKRAVERIIRNTLNKKKSKSAK